MGDSHHDVRVVDGIRTNTDSITAGIGWLQHRLVVRLQDKCVVVRVAEVRRLRELLTDIVTS